MKFLTPERFFEIFEIQDPRYARRLMIEAGAIDKLHESLFRNLLRA
jgi:hypothetical protein